MFFFLSRTFFLFSKAWSLVWGTVWGNLKLWLWGCRCHGIVRCFGVPHLELAGRHQLEIGQNNVFRSSVNSNPAGLFRKVSLATRGKGKITLGDSCGLSGVAIVSESSVTIGDRVQIGANTAIIDTDFHPLDRVARAIPHTTGKSAPVIIGNDVFIGMNCLVLKGVSIGDGSVIGAGSVVTRDVPANVVAAGDPCKVIRSLDV